MSEAPPAAPPPPPPATPPAAPPPSGVQEPWAKSWIKSDFTLDSAALERLPDHLKGIKEPMSRFKSFEDFVGSYANANMLASKKGLAPLAADAPDTVKAERKQLLDTINGVPSNPKDYQIARPEFVPEEQWNPKLVESTSAWAHKHSVSPAALKELTDGNMALVKEQIEGQKQYATQFFAEQRKAFETQIRTENIPLDRADAMAERGASALGVDLATPENEALMKNATFRLAMMRHAVATGEDTTVRGNGAALVGDALQQANDIVQNPANPLHGQYWNKEGKFTQDQNKAAVAKVIELHRMAAAKKK